MSNLVFSAKSQNLSLSPKKSQLSSNLSFLNFKPQIERTPRHPRVSCDPPNCDTAKRRRTWPCGSAAPGCCKRCCALRRCRTARRRRWRVRQWSALRISPWDIPMTMLDTLKMLGIIPTILEKILLSLFFFLH